MLNRHFDANVNNVNGNFRLTCLSGMKNYKFTHWNLQCKNVKSGCISLLSFGLDLLICCGKITISTFVLPKIEIFLSFFDGSSIWLEIFNSQSVNNSYLKWLNKLFDKEL